MRARAPLVLAALAAGAVLAGVGTGQGRRGLEWRHESGRGLSLLLDGVPLWIVHYAPEENWPYVHPLRLPGGPVMTGLSPEDHPWHRALWFSWKFINGTNYWEYRDRQDPNPAPAGRTEAVGPAVVNTTDRGASMSLEVVYRLGTEVVLREKRRIAVETPRPDGSYAFDWEMTFTPASGDVELGKDTGYAGLFFRATADWKEPRYLNGAGQTGMEVHQAPASWIDLSGIVDRAFGPLGVAIFDHPDNPRYPEPWWRDRSKDDDGIAYIGTALLYPGPLAVKAGSSLTLKYRVYAHRGVGEARMLEAEAARFRKGR